MGIGFVKGHGTQNDFVLLPDFDGRLDLTAERVAALCDRRRGLGADGVLRVVRSNAARVPSDAEWFMDYRNADGSLAEMCGNGVRVFARYLVAEGLVPSRTFAVATRAGDRPVDVQDDGSVTVGMGPARVLGTSTATAAGREYVGIAVDVGNPHLVSIVDADVVAMDLRSAPAYDPQFFPDGVNLEFVNRLDAGRLRMRVYERGVGETRACGTGTVAAAVADLHLSDAVTGAREVQVPGGTVAVTVTADETTLCGPAVLVATGELDATWWHDPA